ncbi:PASTA domain-containing protein [Actinomadura sp. 1N219]|uniref:PASTA domain-containing protein n=1 Tax=Actinomadura sp. 1N219 TaxID=3375152 RepID=UPI0037B1531B
MRTFITILAALTGVLTAGCAAPEETPAAAPVTVTKTATPEAAEAAPATSAAATPPSTAPERVKVPRVVGMNHQDAQNRMQDAGLFKLAEVDATGQDRLLLWDRNWVVVKQRPGAGTRVTENATITLYSKKIGE